MKLIKANDKLCKNVLKCKEAPICVERPNRENCPVFCGSGNSSGQSNLSSKKEKKISIIIEQLL